MLNGNATSPPINTNTNMIADSITEILVYAANLFMNSKKSVFSPVPATAKALNPYANAMKATIINTENNSTLPAPLLTIFCKRLESDDVVSPPILLEARSMSPLIFEVINITDKIAITALVINEVKPKYLFEAFPVNEGCLTLSQNHLKKSLA